MIKGYISLATTYLHDLSFPPPVYCLWGVLWQKQQSSCSWSTSLKMGLAPRGCWRTRYLLWERRGVRPWLFGPVATCPFWEYLTEWDQRTYFLFFLFFFSLLRATPMAYVSSHARDLIGALAASLHHSHSNAGSELCLWPTLQLTATPDL